MTLPCANENLRDRRGRVATIAASNGATRTPIAPTLRVAAAWWCRFKGGRGPVLAPAVRPRPRGAAIALRVRHTFDRPLRYAPALNDTRSASAIFTTHALSLLTRRPRR